MGYKRHHAIIVTSFKADLVSRAHSVAADIGLPVTSIQDSKVNRYSTFAVTPDGSKESWHTSGLYDRKRQAFIQWLRDQRYEDGSSPFDWVEVQYGDDDLDTAVDNSSDDDYAGLLKDRHSELESTER